MPRNSYQPGWGGAGWGERAPPQTNPRRQLKKKCGDKCFLRPVDNGFPICPKCLDPNCQSCQHKKGQGDCCQLDCQGLVAAKQRAAQHGYQDIVDKADDIAEMKGWVTKREKRERQEKRRISCPIDWETQDLSIHEIQNGGWQGKARKY